MPTIFHKLNLKGQKAILDGKLSLQLVFNPFVWLRLKKIGRLCDFDAPSMEKK
jgi:hypothetical protein